MKEFLRLCFLISLTFIVTTKVRAETSNVSIAPITLSLKDATLRALNENRNIKKAKEDYNAAKEAVGVTRSKFLPNIELQTSIGTLHDREPSFGETVPPIVARDRNQYDAKVVFKQPLFSGFRDLNELKARDLATTQQEWLLKKTALDVSKEVIEIYFGLQLAQAELEAELQALDFRTSQFKEVTARRAQGRATELEYLEAEYSVSSQDPAIKTLKREISSKSLQLARTIGLPLDQTFTLSDSLTNVGAVLGSAQIPKFTDAYSLATKESPSLKSAELARQRVSLEQSSETSKHFPELSFEAESGYRSNLRNEFGTDDSLHYSGMIKLVVPIFSGLNSFNERRITANRVASSEQDLKIAREQLLQDLTDAYGNLELAESKVSVEGKNKELTKKAVENAQSLFKAGRTTQSSLLDSFSRDLNARRNYAKALYDRIMAMATIRTLTTP